MVLGLGGGVYMASSPNSGPFRGPQNGTAPFYKRCPENGTVTKRTTHIDYYSGVVVPHRKAQNRKPQNPKPSGLEWSFGGSNPIMVVSLDPL